MGLDISVYKVVPRSDNDNDLRQGSYDYQMGDGIDGGESNIRTGLEIFDSLSFEKDTEYYDLERVLTEMGYNAKKMLMTRQEYGEKAELEYVNTEHNLYDAYDWMTNKMWKGTDGPMPITYFDTKEELFNSDLYKKFKNLYLNKLKSEGWKEDYTFYATGNHTHYFNLNKAKDFCYEKVKVVLVDPPTFTKSEKYIRVEEVGYQRKGANKQFYDDNMWDSPPIIDLETLNEHWYKYFSDTKEIMHEFKKSIIDNFIPGETFVLYH